MVTNAGFLSKVFWIFKKWTKINVQNPISEKTFPTKNERVGLHV
jgi:hypothetical protein